MFLDVGDNVGLESVIGQNGRYRSPQRRSDNLNARTLVSKKIHGVQKFTPIQANTGEWVEDHTPCVKIFDLEIRKRGGLLKRASASFLQPGADLRGEAKEWPHKYSFALVGISESHRC